MRTRYFIHFFAVLALLSMGINLRGQEKPYMAPIPDQTATLGDLYTYDVDADYADPPETYELLDARPGMTINPSTGLITWTPANASDGGRVTVRAYNTEGEAVRSYLIYLTDAIVCADDLTSYWKLDDLSDVTFEDYQGGYTANSLTPLTDTEGVVERAKTMSPLGKTEQYMYVTDQGQYDFARSGGFTVSLWFKYQGQHTGDPVNQVLVARGDPSDTYAAMFYMLMINEVDYGSPRVTFQLRPKIDGFDRIKVVAPNISIMQNQWYHLVAVYQGAPAGETTYLKVFINNVKNSYNHIFPNVDFVGDQGYDLQIGYWSRYETNRYPFNGSMDELLVYNKALSDAEVSAIYADGLASRPHCKPGNYFPLISSTPVTTATQNEPYSYTLTAEDYEGGNLVLSAPTIPDWLTFDPGSGLLSGTPGQADVGDNNIVLQASDGEIDITQDFIITVGDVNDPPVFTSTPDTTAVEGEAYTYIVVAEDPEDDDITYTAEILPDWLSFDDNTQILVGIPERQHAGDNNVKIVASDGLLEDTQEFVIKVQSDNSLPVFTSIPVTEIDNYGDYEYQVSAFDADVGDVLSFRADLIPSWLSFDTETNVLSGVPTKQDVGDHSVILVVTDGFDEVPQPFTVTVRNVNTAPDILSEPSDTAKVGLLYTYLMVVVDYDGDPVSFSPTIVPDWMTFDAGSRVLSGTPTSNELGEHNVIITVSDGIFTINHQFVVTVAPRWGVGIEQREALVSKVYPNPTDDYVTFEVNTSVASTLEILELSGKVVKVSQINRGVKEVTLDVSDLKNGLYMYRVYNENHSQEGKLIIK